MHRVVARAIGRQTSPARITRRWTTRQASTSLPEPPPPNARPGFERILSRTPKFLRPTLSGLRNAPLTHITAFLILHEITAIVPLFGLAGTFHYYNWLPSSFAEGAWVVAGAEKFGRYFRRKGWIGEAEEVEAGREVKAGVRATETEEKSLAEKGGEADGVRLVIEFATAYAITKALLPVRIFLSAWGAPWFARWTVIPIGKSVKRILGR